MRVCVIDGQGGGIGNIIIRRLKEDYGEKLDIWALGTNAIATAQMMKAGANRGATGENAVKVCTRDADVVIGPISIVLANSMMGEVTAEMATAVADCRARKFLLPLTLENVEVVAVRKDPLPHLVDELVGQRFKEFLENV